MRVARYACVGAKLIIFINCNKFSFSNYDSILDKAKHERMKRKTKKMQMNYLAWKHKF